MNKIFFSKSSNFHEHNHVWITRWASSLTTMKGESNRITVKSFLRGHLWDKEKVVQFIWNFLTGQEKGDLLIQVAAK